MAYLVYNPERGTLKSTATPKEATTSASASASGALPASLEFLPGAEVSSALPARRSTRQRAVPDGELDAAFRDFYEQVKAFSHGIRMQLGEASARDTRIRAAQNVHVARTMFGKWSLEILSALYGDRSIGFEDLRRTLHGITPSVLSYRLKRMEHHGMVAREVQTTRPVRVRYRLTPKGLTVAVLGEPVFLFLQYSEAKERRGRSGRPSGI